MPRKTEVQESISNLSMGLIEHGLTLLQTHSFPVYKKNIDQRDPPFAPTEFTPSAIAILLISSGLDYHLARLKWFRDVAPQNPPLPHPTYFNWAIGDALSEKIARLLIKKTEKRLKEQLIELTIVRDSVAHPRLYLIKQAMRSDLSFGKPRAEISRGAELRPKALRRKLKGSERTKSLQLPLVSNWISYPDAVTCVLVLHRFLNLLEAKYGNPYAWVGRFHIRNTPAGFFKDESESGLSLSMEEWVTAFFHSLSHDDQVRVKKRLGKDYSKYLHKALPRRRFGKGTVTDIVRAMQNPPKPAFLKKAPPWPINV
jgi:hypothetical protein